MKVKPVPDGFRTVTPYLVVNGAAEALDFYARAFGAKQVRRMTAPDGRIAHAEIEIGDSRIMLSEEFKEQGGTSPRTLKGTPVHIFLYVPDADATVKQAVSAGAQVVSPLADMFWGDRWGVLVDPYGHTWQVATHKEDLTPEEMAKRTAKATA
jgi:PhnB protein